MDQSPGIRTTESVDPGGPVAPFTPGTLEQGKNGHHALKRPHTDMLPIGDHDLSPVNRKGVPHQHGLVAITVDFFHGDLETVHVMPLDWLFSGKTAAKFISQFSV
jgi:hypothetical protein